MESCAGRFWRYENAYISLVPVDDSQPGLGGRVRAKLLTVDWRTFTINYRTLYGIYTDDMITFGEFDSKKTQGENPFHNENLLLKIVDETPEGASIVPDKHTFRFLNNTLTYQRQVNGESRDLETEHEVKEIELTPQIDQSWSEVFFYGLGNKRI